MQLARSHGHWIPRLDGLGRAAHDLIRLCTAVSAPPPNRSTLYVGSAAWHWPAPGIDQPATRFDGFVGFVEVSSPATRLDGFVGFVEVSSPATRLDGFVEVSSLRDGQVTKHRVVAHLRDEG